jgi:hypothetical protein
LSSPLDINRQSLPAQEASPESVLEERFNEVYKSYCLRVDVMRTDDGPKQVCPSHAYRFGGDGARPRGPGNGPGNGYR